MKKTRIKYGILLLGLILILSSCQKTDQEMNVVLLTKAKGTEFWDLVYRGAEDAANKYGITLTYEGPKDESSYYEQADILMKVLEEKPSAVLLAAGDYLVLKEQVEKSTAPIIMVDSLMEDNKYGFITTNNYDVGCKLAEEVIARHRGEGKIGIVNYVKNTTTAIEREQGFRDTIAAKSNLEIVDTVFCDANIEKARKQTNEMLEKYPDITFMVGMNAQSTIGIAKAVKENREQKAGVKVAGVDCVVEEAAYVEEDIIEVCILQNPYMMGYYSVEKAHALLNKKSYEDEIYVDTYVIDKSTLFNKESQELIFPFKSTSKR